MTSRLVLWFAQGLGSGRLPGVPGTWGSLVGLLWLVALLAPAHPLWFLVGGLGGVLLAVPICTQAERHLGRKDPGSVVLDEIVAVPWCYVGLGVVDWLRQGEMPGLELCFRGTGWLWMAAGFGLFRILDAAKPPPIRGLQDLPGGWGVVMDDMAAALVAAVVLGLVRAVAG
jgi:phosphatidylglycerophosphatase A